MPCHVMKGSLLPLQTFFGSGAKSGLRQASTEWTYRDGTKRHARLEQERRKGVGAV